MKKGYSKEDFTATGENGTNRLRNIGKRCYFYNVPEKRCNVYSDRPLGWHLHPIVYPTGEGVVIDELCPICKTMTKRELDRKRKVLIDLVKTLEAETKSKII